jgi:hypothetical protein
MYWVAGDVGRAARAKRRSGEDLMAEDADNHLGGRRRRGAAVAALAG